MSSSHAIADVQTGEMHYVQQYVRSNYGFGKNEEGKRHMVLGARAAQILMGNGYPASAYRLLMFLCLETDETCIIRYTQAEMAEHTGMSLTTIERSMAALRAGNHVYRTGPVLNLNPLTAFTGSGAEHQKAIARMPEHLRDEATVRHLHPVS